MAHGRFYVGTSGWSYREWRGSFYPPGLIPARFLEHYAGRFAAVEANSTAYGLPTPETVQRWKSVFPPGFLMAIKAQQTITHRARLRGCQRLLRELFACVSVLEAHLGPILFQLPPNQAPDPTLLRAFLADARAIVGPMPLAFEFRDPAWYQEEVFSILKEASVVCCLHDMPGSEFTVPRDDGFLYIRKHGTTGRYTGAYGAEKLTIDADLITARLSSGRDAYAFFNNTASGDALADAELLRSLVRERLPDLPTSQP
jgi:uncharacterized protein YecE (DUF72 family)